MTYYYCTPKKEFAGKVLMDMLRKRWLNEPIGVPEDATDQVFLGLKNGKNQEQYDIPFAFLSLMSVFTSIYSGCFLGWDTVTSNEIPMKHRGGIE